MRTMRPMPILLLALLIATSACASPTSRPASQQATDMGAQQRPSTPKRVTIAIRGNPPNLGRERTHPSGSVSSVPGLDALTELVHAGLTHPNDQGVQLPQLAEAVPTIENGLWKILPDGRMETTWKIRPNARWQDGQPVTTEDLTFTTQVEQDKELPIPANPMYEMIERIETPDNQTVTVTWKQAFIEADQLFSYAAALPLPKHLLERPLAEDKANFFGIPYWTNDFVGAGPYKVKDWAMDSHVVLSANPDYALGRPKIDDLEVRFIADPTTLMANVLAGVEMTIGRALSLDQALQVKDQWREGSYLLRSRAWTPVNAQFMNPTPVIVSDARFRQALLQAIDRQLLVDTIMAGQTSIAHSWVSPESREYKSIESSIVKYDFDARRSVQMIESLGYRRGTDGFFADGNGQRLTVELRTTVQNPIHTATTATVANLWEQVGVGVEQNLVSPQLAQDREYRANFPAFELVQTGNGLTTRDVRKYHSGSIAMADNRYTASGNNSRFANPEIDAAIERYVTTIPFDDRMQALAKIVNVQTTNLSVMGLIFSTEPTMVANRLKNITARSERATEAWNAHEWDVQ
jgi:peptide/nickel transport system substrate-binding protein